jgi:hypothetical protein
MKGLGVVAVGGLVVSLWTTIFPIGTVQATPKLADNRAPMVSASPAKANNPGHGKTPLSSVQTSLDWAGYAVTGTTFTNVAGSWTQPTATCPKNQLQEAAFWVGIDGYASTDPTVQQIGTDSDCTKAKGKAAGGPHYYAWYQLYPQSDVVLSSSTYPVAAGDAITASVSASGSAYTLSISDGSKWHYSISQTPQTQPQNSSAEWIVEAPCTGSKCKILPLADFGSIGFTSASANHQPISYSGFTDNQIDMTNKGGKKTEARTSALSSGGSGFSVTWLKS